mgnify:CR=1 FL=1
MYKRYIEYIKLLKVFKKFLTVFKYILLFVSAIFVITNIIFFSGFLDILFKITISIIINLLWFLISRIITRKLLINKEANIDEE